MGDPVTFAEIRHALRKSVFLRSLIAERRQWPKGGGEWEWRTRAARKLVAYWNDYPVSVWGAP